MVSRKGRIRLLLVVFGALAIVFAGSVIVALSVPRYRWRVKIAELKVAGKLPDITWKELAHFNRHGDPFNLQGLVTTRNPYLAIKDPFATAEDISAGQKTL